MIILCCFSLFGHHHLLHIKLNITIFTQSWGDGLNRLSKHRKLPHKGAGLLMQSNMVVFCHWATAVMWILRRNRKKHCIKNNSKTELFIGHVNKIIVKNQHHVTNSTQLLSMHRNKASNLYSVTHKQHAASLSSVSCNCGEWMFVWERDHFFSSVIEHSSLCEESGDCLSFIVTGL